MGSETSCARRPGNLAWSRILSADYARWYATFVERIRRKQDEIENVSGAEWYRFVLAMYSGLHDVIASGKLGGAIVHAIAD